MKNRDVGRIFRSIMSAQYIFCDPTFKFLWRNWVTHLGRLKSSLIAISHSLYGHIVEVASESEFQTRNSIICNVKHTRADSFPGERASECRKDAFKIHWIAVANCKKHLTMATLCHLDGSISRTEWGVAQPAFNWAGHCTRTALGTIFRVSWPAIQLIRFIQYIERRERCAPSIFLACTAAYHIEWVIAHKTMQETSAKSALAVEISFSLFPPLEDFAFGWISFFKRWRKKFRWGAG